MVTDSEHGGKDGLWEIFAETSNFSGRGHVDAQYGISLLETTEGKLGGFDTDVVKIKFGFCRFFDGEPQHDTGSEFNEIYL